VSVHEAKRRWAEDDPCHHRDGWHLNMGRLRVPPPLMDRQSLRWEMRRRIELLPPEMQHEDVYRREDYWRAFLAW
jgi:hypothetical protein